jgi:selenocysteine lyase/cysteine desulfurase
MREAQAFVARRLGLPDPASIAFGPNTHGFVMRLLSCLPTPARVLTTDAEFHSFTRQIARLEEDGLVVVERVAAEPFATFQERMGAAAARGGHDLVFFSQVLFDSGFVVPDVGAIVAAVPEPEALVVVDGYHAFMALPADHGPLADRAFFLGGGYKYAMAGEGACFLHCPPGYAERPRDTGWFAEFEALEAGRGGVAYAPGGSRFLGATFDPSGLYRFVAVQRWLDAVAWDEPRIHTHVRALQQRLLDGLPDGRLARAELLPAHHEVPDRGNFLTFRTPLAGALQARLAEERVVVDHRGDRLRIGLGVYHGEADVDELLTRLRRIAPASAGGELGELHQ